MFKLSLVCPGLSRVSHLACPGLPWVCSACRSQMSRSSRHRRKARIRKRAPPRSCWFISLAGCRTLTVSIQSQLRPVIHVVNFRPSRRRRQRFRFASIFLNWQRAVIAGRWFGHWAILRMTTPRRIIMCCAAKWNCPHPLVECSPLPPISPR